MIRLALKNIWARKKRCGWLLAELVVVSVILWHLMDPLVVQTYVNCLPDGFDEENLYLASLSEYEPSSSRYQEEATKKEVRSENLWRIRERVSHYPGVESATFQIGHSGPGSISLITSGYSVSDSISDSIYLQHEVYFVPKSDYFTTFRYKTAGGPSVRQMDQMLVPYGKIIFTENAYPDGPSFGRKSTWPNNEEKECVASLLPVKIQMFLPPQQVKFSPSQPNDVTAIIFRLREGIEPSRFFSDFQAWANRELQLGNFFVSKITDYHSYTKNTTRGTDYDYRVNALLTGFFLFCVFFGVSGTFWMHTRNRREEIGIMKSFGATSGRMLRLFLLEGGLLTTVAVALGLLVYLQYALQAGLYSIDTKACGPLADYWFDSFTVHFLVVSAGVWLLMLLITFFGIYVPVRTISRITPTEALHEE